MRTSENPPSINKLYCESSNKMFYVNYYSCNFMLNKAKYA